MAWFCKDCGETLSDYAVEHTPVAELDLRTGRWRRILDPSCIYCGSLNIVPTIAWFEVEEETG